MKPWEAKQVKVQQETIFSLKISNEFKKLLNISWVWFSRQKGQRCYGIKTQA